MKSVHILLVEDNEGDILLTTQALKEGKIANQISVVRNGEDALDFLNQKGKYINETLPDLILLDVNLPRKNGHEVLQYIKTKDDMMHIPVIMLTTSSSDRDINISYRNHANCFITKPVESGTFLNVISEIESFWINVIKLPSLK